MHACAHNPTGLDPTEGQWQSIADAMQKRGHFPFFDCAYQGFASGDLDKDAYAVRLFEKKGFEFFVAQSYSKNFGLYNERVGCLVAVVQNKVIGQQVVSQMKRIIRAMISNPPAFGARIVTKILTTEALYEEWLNDLRIMVKRIKHMRKALYKKLLELETPGDWTHIISQKGMFSYTGLTEDQSAALLEYHHIFLTKNGRISLAGLNSKNVQYVAACMDEVVRKFPKKSAFLESK